MSKLDEAAEMVGLNAEEIDMPLLVVAMATLKEWVARRDPNLMTLDRESIARYWPESSPRTLDQTRLQRNNDDDELVYEKDGRSEPDARDERRYDLARVAPVEDKRRNYEDD